MTSMKHEATDRMKRHLAAGVFVVVAAEVAAMLLPDRRFMLWVSGVAVALVLLGVRWFLVPGGEQPPAESDPNDLAESLRRWLVRTETWIRWSESSRSDWDRNLRPMLARQFEMATHQKQSKDPAAFQATGRVLFGPQLWAWVDPENVDRAGARGPGPGRAVLDEILQRLEQV
jgi:hypothetical protein